MTKWSIEKSRLIEVCELLGRDPDEIAKIVITPYQVDITVYDLDENGNKYYDEENYDTAKHIERLVVVEEVDAAPQA